MIKENTKLIRKLFWVRTAHLILDLIAINLELWGLVDYWKSKKLKFKKLAISYTSCLELEAWANES